ncbi:MAG: chemosensory pili system protein ChpC [Gammaproteobacteria bacterium]|jgi:chemosensory pili system protein ChpC
MSRDLKANVLATLLIPLHGKQLVLPNVAVAEIIPFIEPEIIEGCPSWFLGHIKWRDVSVPLISFELINGDSVGSNTRSRRIAVLNGLLDGDDMPFCGIVIDGVPRLMRIIPSEIAPDDISTLGPSELSRVLVSGEKATIPDIDYFQNKLHKFLMSM